MEWRTTIEVSPAASYTPARAQRSRYCIGRTEAKRPRTLLTCAHTGVTGTAWQKRTVGGGRKVATAAGGVVWRAGRRRRRCCEHAAGGVATYQFAPRRRHVGRRSAPAKVQFHFAQFFFGRPTVNQSTAAQLTCFSANKSRQHARQGASCHLRPAAASWPVLAVTRIQRPTAPHGCNVSATVDRARGTARRQAIKCRSVGARRVRTTRKSPVTGFLPPY